MFKKDFFEFIKLKLAVKNHYIQLQASLIIYIVNGIKDWRDYITTKLNNILKRTNNILITNKNQLLYYCLKKSSLRVVSSKNWIGKSNFSCLLHKLQLKWKIIKLNHLFEYNRNKPTNLISDCNNVGTRQSISRIFFFFLFSLFLSFWLRTAKKFKFRKTVSFKMKISFILKMKE